MKPLKNKAIADHTLRCIKNPYLLKIKKGLPQQAMYRLMRHSPAPFLSRDDASADEVIGGVPSGGYPLKNVNGRSLFLNDRKSLPGAGFQPSRKQGRKHNISCPFTFAPRQGSAKPLNLFFFHINYHFAPRITAGTPPKLHLIPAKSARNFAESTLIIFRSVGGFVVSVG